MFETATTDTECGQRVAMAVPKSGNSVSSINTNSTACYQALEMFTRCDRMSFDGHQFQHHPHKFPGLVKVVILGGTRSNCGFNLEYSSIFQYHWTKSTHHVLRYYNIWVNKYLNVKSIFPFAKKKKMKPAKLGLHHSRSLYCELMHRLNGTIGRLLCTLSAVKTPQPSSKK